MLNYDYKFNMSVKKIFSFLTDEKEPDYIVFLLVSFLIILGIVFSYSLSTYVVMSKGYSDYHFFLRQLIVGVVSILIMFVFSQIRPEILISKVGIFLFIVFGIAVLILPFLPDSIATASGGAKRWIRLPFISISPTEFFKIGFIYFLAFSFNRKLTDITKLSLKEEIKLIIPYILVFIVFAIFVAVSQKDFGNTFLIALIIYCMLIFVNISGMLLVYLFLLGVGSFIFLIFSQSHRLNRIMSWWGSVQDSLLSYFPESIAIYLKVDNPVKPHQVDMSLNAIHNGGFLGQGIGNGTLKLGFLPEVHTDFVLAGIAEEIGFLGLTTIILIFAILIFRIMRFTSNRVENKVYFLFSLGIAFMLSFTLLINSFGITGIIPIKGIAVPFLSYGGSSVLSQAIAIGLILSISRNRKQKNKADTMLSS